MIEPWDQDGRKPRYLHEPVWGTPGSESTNTDPWVFGDRFRYSNCKQLTPSGRPSALQGLTPGSVVLFGSQLDDEFVLDTLFVVKDRQEYAPVGTTHLDVDEAFRTCTLQTLHAVKEKPFDLSQATFSLFGGAMHAAPVAGMFSFVPARLAGDVEPRFERPAIHLPGYVNPRSKQSPSGAKQARTLEEVRSVWGSVRQQILQAGCVLGVGFPTPPRVDTAESVTQRGRAC